MKIQILTIIAIVLLTPVVFSQNNKTDGIIISDTLTVDGDITPISEKKVLIADFLKNTKLVCNDTTVTIISFSVEWNIHELVMLDVSNSAEFPEFFLEAAKRSKGKSFYFSKITGVNNNGKTIELPAFWVQIIK